MMFETKIRFKKKKYERNSYLTVNGIFLPLCKKLKQKIKLG